MIIQLAIALLCVASIAAHPPRDDDDRRHSARHGKLCRIVQDGVRVLDMACPSQCYEDDSWRINTRRIEWDNNPATGYFCRYPGFFGLCTCKVTSADEPMVYLDAGCVTDGAQPTIEVTWRGHPARATPCRCRHHHGFLMNPCKVRRPDGRVIVDFHCPETCTLEGHDVTWDNATAEAYYCADYLHPSARGTRDSGYMHGGHGHGGHGHDGHGHGGHGHGGQGHGGHGHGRGGHGRGRGGYRHHGGHHRDPL